MSSTFVYAVNLACPVALEVWSAGPTTTRVSWGIGDNDCVTNSDVAERTDGSPWSITFTYHS